MKTSLAGLRAPLDSSVTTWALVTMWPLGVEDEARALGGAAAAAEDRADRDHSRRGLAEDLGRVEAVLGGLHDDLRRCLGDGLRLRGGVVAVVAPATTCQRESDQRQQPGGVTLCPAIARTTRYGHAAALGADAAVGVATPARERGRSSVKAVKRLLEAIATRPSMRWASSRAIASPSPEPPAESAV